MKNIKNMADIFAEARESKKSESIHSGQFMVSHFENNDEEDIETDEIIEKVEEEIGVEVGAIVPVRTCTDLQPYNSNLKGSSDFGSIIDTDLSTVFRTLRVTYTQKLTSPKWNPFKGIRLRWKEKIRLNNVIWRCWHMQFIMKRKPLVCQFASPLDVDIHNTPQAILLEGKYWKRKWNVIKNEYIRWRKYHTRALGHCNIDTTSEIDFLEWSPPSTDTLLRYPDGMPSDTLFSTISQFPFPDYREIARAGRADFIQPSLGPLQPNFDDLMDLDLEFFNFATNPRLPPVPEEETTDILKAIDCNFAMIESASTVNSQATQSMSVGVSNPNNNSTNPNSNVEASNVPMNIDSVSSTSEADVFAAKYSSQTTMTQQQLSNLVDNSVGNAAGQAQSALATYLTDQQASQQSPNDVMEMSDSREEGGYLRNKIPRGYYKSHRREPINYDKSQPTKHQTILYNQLYNQQQQMQQQSQSQNIITANVQCYPNAQLYGVNPANISPLHVSPIQTTTNNYNISSATSLSDTNVINLSNSELQAMRMQQPQQSNIQIIQSQMSPPPLIMAPPASQQSVLQSTIVSNTNFNNKTPLYSPLQQNYKLQQGGNYQVPQQRQIMRQPSPPRNTGAGMDVQQYMTAKEMYRSNSLPLNATLSFANQAGSSSGSGSNKDESFIVPRHPRSGTCNKVRNRSNSINLNRSASQILSTLQSANSEPMLNVNSPSSALLAQLLSNNSSNIISHKHSVSSSAIHSPKHHSPSTMQTNQAMNVPQQNITQSTMTPSPALQHKSLTFPAPSVQNQIHHQSASTGMPTSVLTSLKMSLQHHPQQPLSTHGSTMSTFSPSTTSHSISTPSLSPDSALDIDMPMSPTNRQTSSLNSSGVVSSASTQMHSFGSSSSTSSVLSTTSTTKEPSRRAGHIHAEQKRRYNIKNGFDMLHSLIPQLQQNPNAKLSKAAMLQKGADYIRQLRTERGVLMDKMESLKQEVDALNNSLNHLQTALPANGAPVLRQRNGRMSELYEQYVRYRTQENWKYWIFGLIFEPMMQTFNSTVSVASMEDLCRTTYNWVDQHCSLVELRPAVSTKLRVLSTTTDLLSDSPTCLQDEVRKALSTGSTSSKSSSSGYQSRS